MQCQIISIGDELLLGDTINTNAGWLGRTLSTSGGEVTKVHTVRDDANAIRCALEEGLQQADFVVTTGGLGPTHDDITKQTIADYFDVALTRHEPTLSYIKKTFKKRGIPFSQSNYGQAEVPENAEVLFNKQGTAPGLWFEEHGKRLAVLPGIPREMKSLVRHQVLPRIKPFVEGQDRKFSRHIKVAGLGESTLSDEVVGPLDDFLSDEISMAYLPSPQANTMRITTRAKTEEEAGAKSEALVNHIYNRAGKYIIGEGKEQTLSAVVGKVLREHELKVAAAESCTGGLLSDTLTNVPGSSDYMTGGIVAYDNQVKVDLLGVNPADIKEHGAVSKAVALQMARGVAKQLKSDIGVSTTGIAGPGGGTDEKPVGTVWISFWSENKHFALKAVFGNDRRLNKQRSVAVALETIRRTVLGIEPLPYDLKPHIA